MISKATELAANIKDHFIFSRSSCLGLMGAGVLVLLTGCQSTSPQQSWQAASTLNATNGQAATDEPVASFEWPSSDAGSTLSILQQQLTPELYRSARLQIGLGPIQSPSPWESAAASQTRLRELTQALVSMGYQGTVNGHYNPDLKRNWVEIRAGHEY